MIKVFTIIKDQSERIPKKNFQILNGKELWKNLIEELSGFDIYINTDSEDVIRELNSKEKYKHITCIKRKNKHIEWEENPNIRNSPVEEMFNDFARDYCDDEDILVLTHVTSPFLKK